jgi:hypothetical protein
MLVGFHGERRFWHGICRVSSTIVTADRPDSVSPCDACTLLRIAPTLSPEVAGFPAVDDLSKISGEFVIHGGFVTHSFACASARAIDSESMRPRDASARRTTATGRESRTIMTSAPARSRIAAKSLAASASEMWITFLGIRRLYTVRIVGSQFPH